MAKLAQLAQMGQSIWFDFIRRCLLESGDMQKLVDQGVTGVTSNPSIFEKAIAQSNDYDAQMEGLVKDGKSVNAIYEALAIEDIAMVADILRPVYDRTGGADGFVSLEVDPFLAHETQKTVSEAMRLFNALGRPNVMIKVPATREGIPAITQLIAVGINVNVTLLFSVENYRQAALAFMDGLEELARKGPQVPGGCGVSRIGSVASFFVSRLDSAVDKLLVEKGEKGLVGKTALANSKAAYQAFMEIFSGPRWESLEKQCARVQRVLWASTSTKNPDLPDTLYVDQLIGPYTVNTLPPATLEAFLDHGKVEPSLTRDMDQARAHLAWITELGIDLDKITDKLQADGVASFAKSFAALTASVAEKRRQMSGAGYSQQLGEHAKAVAARLELMGRENILSRVWRKDHSVWRDDPSEIANRLGWLFCPENMADKVGQISAFADDVRAAGMDRVLLLGMGGSSLASEMLARVFGTKPGWLELRVLDSTDPGAVLAAARWARPQRSLFIVSTKSGGTVETLSFAKYFFGRAKELLGDEAASHFAAITDPGSVLEKMGADFGFRKVFLNDPDIGGRYSALSYFGLVPAALCGVEVGRLLERARVAAEDCRLAPDGGNPAAMLACAMGELALAGTDKLSLFLGKEIAPFGAWVEQLVAESTGKDGKGVLPVVEPDVMETSAYAGDRFFVFMRLVGDKALDKGLEALAAAGRPVVDITLDGLYDLGGWLFVWEMATALAGWVMGVQPFDQPNVEAAKRAAKEALAQYERTRSFKEQRPVLEADGIRVFGQLEADSPAYALKSFLAQAVAGRDYVAIQAFMNPYDAQSANALEKFRALLQEKTGLAVTLAYGPRFLHSTGQLHKGDSGKGLFIQLWDHMPEDAPIPDQMGQSQGSLSFGILKTAQRLGDAKALLDAGRRLLGLDLGSKPAKALAMFSADF